MAADCGRPDHELAQIAHSRGANFSRARPTRDVTHTFSLQIVRRRGKLPRIAARFTIQAALLAVLLLSIAAPPASAGTMVVYSCHTPAGRTVGVAGWSFLAFYAQPGLETGNHCAAGSAGSLSMQLRESITYSRLEWRFDAPPDVLITRYTAYVCARTHVNADARIEWGPTVVQGYRTDQGQRSFGCHGTSPWRLNTANSMQAAELSTSRIEFSVGCYTIDGCTGPGGSSASFAINSFRAELLDASSPVVSSVGGTMATNSVHSGPETIVFTATDAGVGLLPRPCRSTPTPRS